MKAKSAHISALLGIGVMLALTSAGQAIIVVTPNGSASALAGVIAGSGVTVISSSISGNAAQSGTFTGGLSAGIGIDNGIVLTSGLASNVTSSNTSGGISGNMAEPGSAILDALVPGYTTHDANILTITFTTAGGDLFFNYLFGSEEYNEWVGSSFNDVFGFFLDGTAVSNNIALIPGTSTPVAINNVNLGSNATYYNNNDTGAFAFEYDGFTDVFTAKALGLSAGEHTITLAIADSGDFILDSGVFIQAGTFSDTPTPTPDGGTTFALLGGALAGLAGLRRKLRA